MKKSYFFNLSKSFHGAWTTYFSIICMLLMLSSRSVAQDYINAFSIGSTSIEEINCMTRDANNNIYISGNFFGTVDFDPSVATANLVRFGPNSGFLAKYDAAGNYKWAVDFVSGNAPMYGGYDMEIDYAGNLVVTGYFFDSAIFNPTGVPTVIRSNGAHDAFIAKYDTAGNFIWAKSFGGPAPEYGLSLSIDPNNNIYVGGYFTTFADFDPGAGTATLNGNSGSPDAFIAKYDANGDYKWAINVGGPSQDEGREVALDASGNVYLTGYFQDAADFDGSSAGTHLIASNGLQDIFITKYDSSGNFVWANGIGGTGNDVGTSMEVDGAGNIYLTGTFESNVDFDPSSGGSTLLSSSGANDIFMAKYDTNGDIVWAKKMGGSAQETSAEIDMDGKGYLYLTGFFNGAGADFDPSAGTAILNSNGDNDIFMARYDNNGDYLWAVGIGGVTSDKSLAMNIENAENIYIAGLYSATVDFDPSAATANLTATAGPNDVFVAKYNFCVSQEAVLFQTICKGEQVEWEGQTISTAGFYSEVYQTALGCDSIESLDLTVDSVEDYTVSKAFATLTANTTLASAYQWIDCDNDTAITAATSASFTADVNGDYAVIVTQNGCSDTSACVTIDSIGVGIGELPAALTTLYPNPSHGLFSFELKRAAQLDVYNAVGEMVYTQQYAAGRRSMDLSHLKEGIYYLRYEQSKAAIKLVLIH